MTCEPTRCSLSRALRRRASDLTPQAAKRVFGIGDPLIIERRAHALAEAASTPIEALDLALYNWAALGRVTLGFHAERSDARLSSGPTPRSN